ncbi:protein of unknown function [Lachnospiraceae bacterium G41]|nr:protein of unknown function [Lachnospiraceae bacterium G41]
MAFTLVIQRKGLFSKAKSIDFATLLNNCKLSYGSYNDFYTMDEGKTKSGTAILFNPNRIGRGIFFDSRNINKGEIKVEYNTPTTTAEIEDFVKVAKEVERQFGKASFHFEDENKYFSSSELEKMIPQMSEFSLKQLNEGSSKIDNAQYILTLAKFPWYMDDEAKEKYKTAKTLDDFEETIHGLQKDDVYYAKPSLFKDGKSGKILAFYTLTSNCESYFPVKPDSFLNLYAPKIDEAFIRFFIYEEEKVVEGHYPYDKFVEFIKEKGATKFDAERLRVPEISKAEIMEFVESVKQ